MNLRLKIFSILFLVISGASAQTVQTATIAGVVTEKGDPSGMIGVNVTIKGTTFGASTDISGKYSIPNLKPGEYTLEFTYLGYEKMQITGIKVAAGEEKKVDVVMQPTVVSFGDKIVVVGKKPLIDVEKAKSQQTIGVENIEAAPARQIQAIIGTQPGVVLSPSGVNIRGSRTYETGFYIDGVSARDPLAGTGFGFDLGSNAVDEIEVSTGTVGAETGDATAGVVSAKTKSGGDKTTFAGMYKRDNFSFNKNWSSVWNQQVAELSLGGPLLKKASKNKLRYFVSFRGNFSDEYTKNPANQVVSSHYPSNAWSPYEDNRWTGHMKLNYNISERRKLSFTYMKSVTINQDVNMLRITGNDVSFNPGYQFLFQQQMDNANTFTHDANLQIINWSHSASKRFAYKATLSRLFVHLRGDANGRPWRPTSASGELDPNSIVTFPATYFNPQDTIAFVNPPSGLYNNGGIATLWHDHYVEEYTLNSSGNYYSKNTFNRLSFGVEFKMQEMQWIDINKPWIGAPIQLAGGGVSQSYRLGDFSDVWKVNPSRGGIFLSDRITYKGLIAEAGFRFEYWAPGKFVDDAINNPASPIRDEIRKDYLASSLKLGSRNVKLRLLPKVSASFPIRENQVLFFNYGHSTILPHPSFVYAGLDPYYTDRSTLSRLGNPGLNPEVDISYELGLKTEITSDDALSVAAYVKDKYDFITSATIFVKDITGREVARTIRINSDYARVRGIEAAYIKRIGKWFAGQISAAYTVATGQSASASESLKEILAAGNREDTREFYLPWDKPFDIKMNSTFTRKTKTGIFNVKMLNNISFYTEAVFRSGRRYTPYIQEGIEPVSGRPIWVVNPNPSARFAGLGKNLFWIDMNLRKWWTIKNLNLAWVFEVTNVLNNKNAAIINPVTGNYYKDGDPVPVEQKDPRYTDPRDPRSGNPPPDDPSRFQAQRHFLTGIIFKF
jgi:outer membrane receptor protein involved in Fe transport